MRILDETGTDPPGPEAAVAGRFEARYPELVPIPEPDEPLPGPLRHRARWVMGVAG